MAWLNIDDNAPHHRKMLAAGDVACWLWICGLAYCQRHMSDGLIPPGALRFLGCAGWKIATPKLVEVGLWHDETPIGYRVHDFLAWNDSAEVRLARKAKSDQRVAKFRASRKRESNAVTVVLPERLSNTTPQPQPQPQETTKNVVSRVAAGAPGVVMSPAEFDRLRKTHRHVGVRVRVPNVLHAELVAKLGGENPDAALAAWYAELDEKVEATRESIPDVFAWLRPKFVAWAGAGAKAEDWAKWAPGGAFDQQIGGKS